MMLFRKDENCNSFVRRVRERGAYLLFSLSQCTREATPLRYDSVILSDSGGKSSFSHAVARTTTKKITELL